jgi:hypothetical protein
MRSPSTSNVANLDAVDAAATCEAVTRPTRFVEVKTPEQQAIPLCPPHARFDRETAYADINMLRNSRVWYYLAARHFPCAAAKDCINDEPSILPMDAQEVVFDPLRRTAVPTRQDSAAFRHSDADC